MKNNKKDIVAEWVFFLAFLSVTVVSLYNTLPESALEKLGIHKPDTIWELSGYSAAMMYIIEGILSLRLCVKYVVPLMKLREFFQPNVDLNIKAKIAQALIYAMAFIIGISISKAQPVPPHIKIAQSFIGVEEHPSGCNCGKEVNMFLKYVGLGPGFSWCAAKVSYCIGVANVASPKIRSASARAFITKESIRAYDVLSGKCKVPDGAIVVWRRGNSWQGHVGFVEKQTGANSFQTIEGNTSNGLRGSQYNGNVCARRQRSIVLTDHFRIEAFTPVTYLKS